MIEHIRGILIGVTKEFGPEETSSALGYGLSLARQAGAHVTVRAASVRLALTNAWVSKFAAGLVNAENRRLQDLAEAAARSVQVDAAAAGTDCSVEAPHLGYPDLLNAFRNQARLHDLSILDAESKVVNLDRGLLEALLMDSGRPLLVVPPGRDAFQARRVILAWDGSAAATRAPADALPFLRAAEAVEVVSVTGEKDLPNEVSGAGIATHLARHGVEATAVNVEAQDRDVAQVLRDAAERFGADMLVMGGYVHSRLRELVFGGVTQSLLMQSPVPLFMSH